MTDPIVRCYTDRFVDIDDFNTLAHHIVRLDSILHIRSSGTSVYIYINLANAIITLRFTDKNNMAVFMRNITDALAIKDKPFNPFAQIEQDLKTLSEKFDELNAEVEAELQGDAETEPESEAEADCEAETESEPESESESEPKYPVAKTSTQCEFFLVFLAFILSMAFTYSFSLTFFTKMLCN